MQANNISSPVYEIQVDRQVPIPMEDGTILRADVYRPTTAGQFPVLVERVAYELTRRLRFSGPHYPSRGYVVVGQNVPILHLGGWFDCFLDSTLRCFHEIQNQGMTETCRRNQRLIIGPWIHGPSEIGSSTVGELNFEVDLLATAQMFAAGHRLRVEVTSSDFPRYDRNLNTGGTFGTESHGHVAHNTLFHDRTRPSYILLPVLPS